MPSLWIEGARKISAASSLGRICSILGMWIVGIQAVFIGGAAQEPPAIYRVEGVVENSVTHQPVARVLVEGMSEAALTDSEGRFELHLPAGTAQITLQRPGYSDGQTFSPGMSRMVRVGPNVQQLTFYITPLASITGHVVLSTGEEADGVLFALYRKGIVEGHARWLPAGNSTVGSDGVIRFVSLDAPASYVLCSAPSQDRIASAQRTAVSGFPGTCYPGGADFTSATPLTLLPGQQAQVDIALTRQAFYPVSIAVANSTQNSFIQISDASGRPTNLAVRRLEQSGIFVVDLPNGSYSAESRQGGKPDLSAHLDFTVAGAPLSGLTMILLPVQTIPIEIHREFTADSNTNIGGFTTRVPQNELNLSLNLIPVDRPFFGPIGAALRHPPGSSDSDVYEIDAPPAGTYRIQASAFQNYVSAMNSAGTDLLREPLVVGPGNTAPIEITVRNDLGRLECSAMTPAAAIAAEHSSEVDFTSIFVYAIPQSSGTQRVYQSVTRGPSVVAGFPFLLPPGSYLVVAFKEAHDIDLDDADEMSRLAKEGQMVTIEPGKTTQLQLDPISAVAQEASE